MRDSQPVKDSMDAELGELLDLMESGDKTELEVWIRQHQDQDPERVRLYEDCLAIQLSLQAHAGRSKGEESPYAETLMRSLLEDRLGPSELSLAVGQDIAGYRLVRPLGRGGMGEVWEAEERALHRSVALKVLLPHRITARGIRFFEREARAGGRLQYPGIVSVFAAGEAHGLCWIAQELVPNGHTLAADIRARRERDAGAAINYPELAQQFEQLALAMQAAHDAGVIHRDLKPQNLLITPDGRPKISDFGLARIVDEEGLSNSGEVAGTYNYMSPEQVSGSHGEIDERTDVFSLGVVLYEALTLQRPFDADSSAEVAVRILNFDPRNPRAVRRDVPSDLALICQRAMEKSPSRRFQTMGELAAELRRYLDDRPLLTQPPGLARRLGKWARRHPGPTTGIAVAALGAVIIGLLLADASRADRRLGRLTAQTHRAAAWMAIEASDLERAKAELAAAAAAIGREEPVDHLILAAGYSRFGRFGDAQAELLLATSCGFDPSSAIGGGPSERYGYALYLLMQQDSARYAEIAELLESVARAGPEFRGSGFLLYQVRLAAGDVDEAREALELYGVPSIDAQRVRFRELVEALLLELDGEGRGRDRAIGRAARDDRRARRGDDRRRAGAPGHRPHPVDNG